MHQQQIFGLVNINIVLTANYVTPDFDLKARWCQTAEILTNNAAQVITNLLQLTSFERVEN